MSSCSDRRRGRGSPTHVCPHLYGGKYILPMLNLQRALPHIPPAGPFAAGRACSHTGNLCRQQPQRRLPDGGATPLSHERPLSATTSKTVARWRGDPAVTRETFVGNDPKDGCLLHKNPRCRSIGGSLSFCFNPEAGRRGFLPPGWGVCGCRHAAHAHRPCGRC